MSTILKSSITYHSRGKVAAVNYYFELEILDPDNIGKILEYLMRSAEIHLLTNNILEYKLSLHVNSTTIKSFGVPFSFEHDFEIIENRLLLHAQSKLSLLGDDLKLYVNVNAILF